MSRKTILLSDDSDNHSEDDSTIMDEELEQSYNGANFVSTLFSLFCKAKLKSVIPNLYMGLKVAVTLPVSSTTTECSFSKMKLIKN